MPCKMRCFTLQSMGRTNQKFPVYATRNVQKHLKSTIATFRVGRIPARVSCLVLEGAWGVCRLLIILPGQI